MKKQGAYAILAEVYSRVVGYFRPVQSWNKGKQEEFTDRKVVKPDFTEDTEDTSDNV